MNLVEKLEGEESERQNQVDVNILDRPSFWSLLDHPIHGRPHSVDHKGEKQAKTYGLENAVISFPVNGIQKRYQKGQHVGHHGPGKRYPSKLRVFDLEVF